MKKIILITIVLMSFLKIDNLKAQGDITVEKPDGLSGLIYSRTAKKKDPDTRIDGYHILIFRTDNKALADAERNKFIALFPGTFSEVVWDEPVFKVYVGTFKHKWEALILYNLLKKEFTTLMIIRDKVPYPPLNY